MSLTMGDSGSLLSSRDSEHDERRSDGLEINLRRAQVYGQTRLQSIARSQTDPTRRGQTNETL